MKLHRHAIGLDLTERLLLSVLRMSRRSFPCYIGRKSAYPFSSFLIVCDFGRAPDYVITPCSSD